MAKENFHANVTYRVKFHFDGRDHFVETRDLKTVNVLRSIFDTGFVADDAAILQTMDLSDE